MQRVTFGTSMYLYDVYSDEKLRMAIKADRKKERKFDYDKLACLLTVKLSLRRITRGKRKTTEKENKNATNELDDGFCNCSPIIHPVAFAVFYYYFFFFCINTPQMNFVVNFANRSRWEYSPNRSNVSILIFITIWRRKRKKKTNFFSFFSIPFVRPGYCANSSDSWHHLRFHVHRKISGQISCRNLCRPSSRPISMLADAAPTVRDMANVYDVLNHSHISICCLVHMPMWLRAPLQHLISRM